MPPEPDRPIVHPALQRVRLLTRLLDNAIPIPGTDYRIGLDPLLGLLPASGDTIGAILSAYIVLEAARFGLPRETLTRMVLNFLLDSVLGSLPFLGDIFDATWKSNSRNLALLEAHVNSPQPSRRADRWFIVLLVIVLAAIVIGATALTVLILSLLWRAIAG